MMRPMGFKDWIKEQAAEGAKVEAERQAKKAEKKRIAEAPAFEGLVLDGEVLRFNGAEYPVAGATALVEMGGTQRRTTATRVIVGSAIVPVIGTAIGAMVRKKSTSVYLTVELADGQVIVVEGSDRQEGDAKRFAAAITSAAR